MAELILTTDGNRRLAALARFGEIQLAEALHDAVERVVLPAVVSAAPTHEEEARAISTSIEGAGSHEPFEHPSDDSGRVRFMKTGTQQYVRDAIGTDPVEITRATELGIGRGTLPGSVRSIIAKAGHVDRLNQVVQFSWQLSKKFGNQIRTSSWRNLIAMWEDGGQAGGPVVVTPQAPVRRLFPEDPPSVVGPGARPRFFQSLTKVIPPFQMYRKGYDSTKGSVQVRLQSGLAKAARQVSGETWKVRETL